MQLIRRKDTWNPLREVGELSTRLNQFFGMPDWPAIGEFETLAPTEWVPSVNIRENDKEYAIRAELPGLTKDDVHVTLEQGVLTIQGKHEAQKDEQKEGVRWVERARGSFHRALALPEEVDAEKVTASYRQGVLTVTLPKVPEAKPEVRTIPITTS